MFKLSSVYKLFVKKPKSQKCDECGIKVYTCEECGCQFDNLTSAKICRDWDMILGHRNHVMHNHKE